MHVPQIWALAALASNTIVLAQQVYASNQVSTTKDSDVVAANFPDPAIELFAPAFLNPGGIPDEFENGTSGPTSQVTMESFLQELADRNSWMTYNVPDFSSEEGRYVPYVYLSNDPNSTFNGTTLSTSASNSSSKLRIYIHGGVHGNEPGGDQAVLAFLGALDHNATYASTVLSAADFLVIPRYNPDGVAYFQRYLATGFDPNRDHAKLARQQTRDIKSLNVAFNAHISIDCHEYGAGRTFGPASDLVASQDGQFSAFKNLNIHPRIRNLAEGLFSDNIRLAMDEMNFTHSPYIVVLNPNNSLSLVEFVTDNNGDDQVGLSQGMAFLSETRGIGIGDQSFKRRTAAGLTILSSIVQTAADHARDVLALIEDTRHEYAHSDDEIIVVSQPRPTNITWPFISTLNGSTLNVPVQFGNNTPAEPALTRRRPAAYIFSSAWADVAERLRDAGVHVQQLEEAWEGEVEALVVVNATLARAKFEGVAQTTVLETETVVKTVAFPGGDGYAGQKGAYWVDTRQQRAAHAFVRLEPETESGFASWNVLPVEVGGEWPVYRVAR